MLRYAVETRPKYEVQGFGSIAKGDDGDIWLTDIIIPPQEVSGASVDLNPTDLEKLMLLLSERKQSLSDWPVWWHSHAGMGVSPSGTDTNTLDMLAKEYGGVAIGLVTNTGGDYHGWFSMWTEGFMGQFFTSRKMEVLYEVEADVKLESKVATMMEHVTVEVPKVTSHHPLPFYLKPSGGTVGTGRPAGISKRDWKQLQRLESENKVEDNKPSLGYYRTLQESYAPGSTQRDMTPEKFIEWFNEDNEESWGWVKG